MNSSSDGFRASSEELVICLGGKELGMSSYLHAAQPYYRRAVVREDSRMLFLNSEDGPRSLPGIVGCRPDACSQWLEEVRPAQ